MRSVRGQDTGRQAVAPRLSHAQRRRQLLDAAASLIIEKSLDAVTMEGVAARAGVSKALPYRFFTNRDQILDRLIERELAILDHHIGKAEESFRPRTVREFVDQQLDFYLAYFEARPAAVHLWFHGRMSDTVVTQVQQRNREAGERLHALCVASGLGDTPDPLPFVVMVELGDRIFDVAFRHGVHADRDILGQGKIALAAYMESVLA